MLKQAIKKYIRNMSGTILVAFAVMAPIVVGSAGMALDYAYAYLVQQRLSQAIDSATLAAAADSSDPDVIESKIKEFFRVNYPADKVGAAFDPDVKIVDNHIQVTGHAEYNTFFLSVIGISTIEVTAYTEVTRTIGNNIELALVLDISGSMAGQKIADLKEAAKSLVDIVVYDNQKDYYSKIALVPYAMAVNAGSYAAQVRGAITPAKTITAATKANPVVITSNGHGFANGDHVYITGVTGMTQLNNKVYTVANKATNTFQLSGVDGRNYSTYKSAGSIYCTNPGCQYQYFQSPQSNWNIFQVSTCVSERSGTYAYTDDPPSKSLVGLNYPASGNPCLTNKIVPLTSDKDALKDDIDALVATGSTGGQVGVAWGWYMLDPQFGYLWPPESDPGTYNADHLHKIMVIMTDGEYNSPYCKGVISKDATSGSGNTQDHINCNATNGDSYSQAKKMCDAMKKSDKNIEIYAIGFHVDDYPLGAQMMNYCATDNSHFFTADDGASLKKVFETIAQNVSSIYLSH